MRPFQNLFLIEPTSYEWKATLAFPEYLRTNPDAKVAYERLKLSLADKFNNDGAAYTDGKKEFVEKVVRHALGPYEPSELV
jgi:GrpB-like predicted nucleotidyltransferase (UPF0157 family)